MLFVLGLWFLFVPGSRPATRAFPIAVKVVNVPPGSTLEHVDPTQVTAILSGQRRAFYLFNPDLMDVTIDATLAKYGRRTFAVSEDQIRHPPELTVEDVEPEQVRISLRAEVARPRRRRACRRRRHRRRIPNRPANDHPSPR